MEWITFLSQPIVQLGGVIGSMIALQKMGFDVAGALRSFLGLEAGRALMADNHNSLQPLLSQMEILTQHFNHETTDGQKRIEDHLEIMHSKQDSTVQLLREIKEYGIKCRKD